LSTDYKQSKPRLKAGKLQLLNIEIFENLKLKIFGNFQFLLYKHKFCSMEGLEFEEKTGVKDICRF